MVVFKLCTSVNDYKNTERIPYYVACLDNHHVNKIEKKMMWIYKQIIYK